MTTLDEPAVAESETARLQAAVAALEAQAVRDRADIEGLRVALESARRIGAALGIVMAITKVTEGEAFEVLKRASQNSNRKLREIAGDVVETGVVPS